MRKEQKKVGQSFHDHTFNNKLKNQAQFEKFQEELESTLSMIIGSQGITLSYVISDKEEGVDRHDLPFHDNVIMAAALTAPGTRSTPGQCTR